MENSIYNNTMYFGSNIYDDEVVNKLLYELIGSSLDRNVKDQAIVDDHDVYTGLGSEFAISQRTNSLYGLAADALTLMIPNVEVVPERYKKRFIRKYGYNKPIHFETMLADGQLFNRVPHLYLCNGFLYYGLTIIVRMDQSIILVVHQSGPQKISTSMITKFQSEGQRYQLIMERATTTYTYYGSVSSILVSGHDAIRVGSLRQLTDIMDLSEGSANYNSWNISFSTEIPNDPMLLATIPTSIGTISGATDFAFKYAAGTNTILRGCSGSMRILVEQKPNREAVFTPSAAIAPDINPLDLDEASANPILSLQLYGEHGDEYQPYTSKSIRFWTRTTVSKLPNAYAYLINENDNSNIILKDTGGIYSIDTTNIPSINDLITNNTCPLYVDAQIYQKSLTGTLYDCPVTHSIEAQLKGTDNPFGQELISTHYQRHSRVIGNVPYTSFQYDFEDFKESEFKDDIRAYKLSKLKMLLNSNPDNYKKLADVLYKKTCPVRTAYLSTTADKLPFVKDTSFIATSVRDDTLVFDKEQSYVILHSDIRYWSKPYVSLYVNGVYIHPTYIGYRDFDIYVFFPKVLNQTYDGSSNSFIPTAARDIVVDIYFKSSVDPKDQARSELTFNSTGSPQLLFPNGIKRSTIASKNLIAYNSVTKEIINMSNFNFYTEITTSKVKIDDNEMTITHPTSIDVIYLITNDGEFFKTKDGNLIILSEETTQVPLENDTYATLGNKEMDTDNLYISLNNSNYIGTSITFMSSDKPEIRKFDYENLKTGIETIDGVDHKYIELELPEWYNGDLSDPGSFRLHCRYDDNGYLYPLVDFTTYDSSKAVGYKMIPRSKITDPLKIRIYDQFITDINSSLIPLDLYLEHLPYNWNNAASQMLYDENRWEWDNIYFLPSKENIDSPTPQYLPGGIILGNNLSDTYCPNKVFDSSFDYSQLPITGMPEFQLLLKKYSQIYVLGARISPNNLTESRVLNTLIFNVTANNVPLLWSMESVDKFCQLFIPQMDILKTGFYREDLFHEIHKRPDYGYDMGWYNYFKALSQKIVSSDAEANPNPVTLMTTIYNEAGKAWGWDVDYRVSY